MAFNSPTTTNYYLIFIFVWPHLRHFWSRKYASSWYMRLPVIARRTVRMHECHIKKSFFPIVWCVWVSDKYARIIANPPRDTTHTHRPAQPDCQRSNQILLLFNVFFFTAAAHCVLWKMWHCFNDVYTVVDGFLECITRIELMPRVFDSLTNI